MNAALSEASHISTASKQVLEDVSKKSESRLLQLEAQVNENMINSAWLALGAYLAKNIKLGRAIIIPKFGTFTFSSPNVRLEGVTNPEQRDIRLRRPVFLISKEFVKGMSINTGIVSAGILRPFSMKGVTSGIGETKINYTEIGLIAGLDKDNSRISIERVIKELSEKTKNNEISKGQTPEMDIPNVGKFFIKGQVAGIAFDDNLVNESLDATNKIIKEKRAQNEPSLLTTKNLEEFLRETEKERINEDENIIEIDRSAQQWLKDKLSIDTEELKALSRPKTTSILKDKKKHQELITKQKLEKAPKQRENRPSTALLNQGDQNREALNLVMLERAKTKVKMWIRAKSLLPEDAFYEIACCSLGPTTSIDTKLGLQDVRRGLEKVVGLNLSSLEAEAIFQHLDKNKEGFIDFNKWKTEFTDDRSYLNHIRDVVVKYNLQTDDILRRMGLNRSSNPLNIDELARALTLLDPSLDDKKALKLGKEILEGKNRLDIKELIEVLGCPAGLDESNECSDWYHTQLVRIKKNIGDPKALLEKFENYDTKNRGLLDTASFKFALLKSRTGLDLKEINRLIRYIEKDSRFQIDYVRFVETLEKTKTDEEIKLLSTSQIHLELEHFNIIKEKLINYIRDKGIQPGRIIRKIYEKKFGVNSGPKLIPILDFADFLYGLVKSEIQNKGACVDFARKIDINNDNCIDDSDFNTFLSRNNYIEEGEKQATKSNFFKATSANAELFPKEPLSEARLEVVLRDLRQALTNKGLSYYDFIRMLDVNDVGFITINDFSLGLEKIIQLSQPTKDGLFAYIDKKRIGMISYDEILKLLNRSVLDTNVEVSEDNFDWQEDMIKKIKQYVKEKNLTSEDAFRIADIDFDGNISKKDLTSFLKDIIKIPAEQITTARVARLFKLMDVFKRNSVQLSDFKRLIFDDFETANNPAITGGKQLIGASTFDWKVHARQQIGLLLSKDFPDLKTSFEEISGHSVKLTYKNFASWIEKTRALAGFDLTEKLLQTLFADLDPHKKGYISELDWINTFGGYSLKNQVLHEVQEALNANYSDIQSAFDFFVSHQQEIDPNAKEITYDGFFRAINSLIPSRFDNSEIEFMWKKCFGSAETVNLQRFQFIFDKKKFNGSRYVSSNRTLQGTIAIRKVNNFTDKLTPGTYGKFDMPLSKEEKQKKLFDRVRQTLSSSNIPIERIFKDIDISSTGTITNLELINAIKRLNIGLSLKEIEDLVFYCDTNNDGKITFQEFLKSFAPNDSEKMLFDRSKNKLKKLKENIYAYMLSPKDAFLTFNEDRTGRLTYEQFTNLITRLSQLSREETPSFPIIKDMFDFIDIRKDGIIDMNEWMQSFKLIENPGSSNDNVPGHKRSSTINVSSLTRIHFPNLKGHSVQPQTTKAENQSSNIALNISEWECSKEYEKVLKIIGKNRKLIIERFEDLKNQGITITKEKAKEIIEPVLENLGLYLTPEKWPYLLKFAEKEGIVDYKFLLDVFKERLYLLNTHPRMSVDSL